LVLVEKESNDAGVGDLLFLFDGKELVDGCVDVS
jgi:hypothetical protein